VVNFPSSGPAGTFTIYNSGGGVISTTSITTLSGAIINLTSGGAYFIIT
jgi:hypothetical protein